MNFPGKFRPRTLAGNARPPCGARSIGCERKPDGPNCSSPSSTGVGLKKTLSFHNGFAIVNPSDGERWGTMPQINRMPEVREENSNAPDKLAGMRVGLSRMPGGDFYSTNPFGAKNNKHHLNK